MKASSETAKTPLKTAR